MPNYVGSEEDKAKLGLDLEKKIEKYLKDQEPEKDLKVTVKLVRKNKY